MQAVWSQVHPALCRAWESWGNVKVMATLATLTWTANTEPDLAGYLIYWGLYPGIYTFVTAAGPAATSYNVDSSLLTSDGTYYFAISAYDTSNNESALASPLSGRIIRVKAKLVRRV